MAATAATKTSKKEKKAVPPAAKKGAAAEVVTPASAAAAPAPVSLKPRVMRAAGKRQHMRREMAKEQKRTDPVLSREALGRLVRDRVRTLASAWPSGSASGGFKVSREVYVNACESTDHRFIAWLCAQLPLIVDKGQQTGTAKHALAINSMAKQLRSMGKA